MRIQACFAILLLGCGVHAPVETATSARSAPQASARLHALLISGGGSRESNFQSHLVHLQTMVDVLEASGVPRARISVFASDGDNPDADLATRATADDAPLWLLPHGSALDAVRPPLELTSSSLRSGPRLRAARKDLLRRWFQEQGHRLTAGDTLLLYVTDHGTRNEKDPTNNAIVLWNETMDVSELREWLGLLDPGVRVVMVMSQCFSGSFAGLIYPLVGDDAPSGKLCGYFAVPQNRMASGCYPESRGKDGLGYSHQLFVGLNAVGELPAAHELAQVLDQTPDVPFTTSEAYLDGYLKQTAQAAGVPLESFADGLLAEAWKDSSRWSAERHRLDQLASAYGISPPPSLKALSSLSAQVEDTTGEADRDAAYWGDAAQALIEENGRNFLQANPDWNDRLASPGDRTPLRKQLLAELLKYTRGNEARYDLLRTTHERADQAAALAFRGKVRSAALLRMRGLLLQVAARSVLERNRSAERTAFRALRECEALSLSLGEHHGAEPSPPTPLPSLAADHESLRPLRPSWVGIGWQTVPEERRAREVLTRGAVVLLQIVPESPAMRAGLQSGDVLLGTAETSFDEPLSMRLWTLQIPPGVATTLNVRRGRKELSVTLTPEPYPAHPPPPAPSSHVGSLAPPLRVEPLHGPEPRVEGTARLLLFWSSTCPTCAAALTEAEAMAKTRGIPLLVVTDERRDTAEAFLEKLKQPFPAPLLMDPFQITSHSFGVRETPAFVLIDGNDRIRAMQSGYSAANGLQIDDWESE